MKLLIQFFALCSTSPFDSLNEIGQNAQNLIEEHFRHRSDEEVFLYKKFYSRKTTQMRRLILKKKCKRETNENFEMEMNKICTAIEAVLSTQRKSSLLYHLSEGKGGCLGKK